jgi:Rha family phage regulatory protein
MTNALATIALEITEGRPTTTSNVIAANFGKRHTNVLKAIRNLECSDEFRRLNFEQSSYINEQGKVQPSCRITKNGFAFLAMGFTGKDAALWKESYIAAFDSMAEALAPKQVTTLTPAQKRELQKAVTAIAYQEPTAQRSAKFAEIYRKLKDEFKVAEYGEIPQESFTRAVTLVNTFVTVPDTLYPEAVHMTPERTYNRGITQTNALRGYLQVISPSRVAEIAPLLREIEDCFAHSFAHAKEASLRIGR